MFGGIGKALGLGMGKMKGNTGVAGGKARGPLQQSSGMLGKSSGPMGKIAAGAGSAMGKKRTPMGGGGRGFSSKRY